MESKDLREIITPRGTFKIQKNYSTRQEAIKDGYGMYFTHNNVDIYTKHIGEYSCLFAIVKLEEV